MSIPKRVMVISLDAVGSKDLEYMKTLPNFAAFFSDAAVCERVNSTYPSITYPAHTSIITGKKPAKHGIINNTKLQPGRSDADWIYKRRRIKGTTLYDEAKKSGMTTAGLLWPVIAKSSLDHYVPEVMVTRKWQTQILVNAVNGPVFYQLDLNRRFGHLRDGIRQPALDNFVHASALYTIRKYNPDLFLLHLTDVDTNRHIYGVEHPKVKDALKRHDERLGEILEALAETGSMEETAVVLLGDHYQKDAENIVYLNTTLAKKGYLSVKEGKITAWDAVAKTCDGSCYIYLSDKKKQDKVFCEELDAYIEELAGKPEYGIAGVLRGKEAAKLGADPECFSMLEAAEGFYFLDEVEIEFQKVKDAKKHKMRGTHGYLPVGSDYQTFFAMKGCGIRQKVKVEHDIELWDEGVTLAALLGLALDSDADGKVIEEMLLK